MRRRDLIALLGGAAAAWPLAARAQQTAIPAVGFLNGGSEAGRAPLVAAFLAGLKETGFVEGSNVRIVYRWADFQYDRLPELAADLVRRLVAVIFTSGAVNSTLAAKAATLTIPIVFAHGSDPVEVGLVPRMNRPGGNVTGATQLARELEAKKLELLRELVPSIKTIGYLANPSNPNTRSETREMQALASAGSFRLQVFNASSESEIDAAFAAMAQQKVDAFLNSVDQIFGDRASQIAALALRYKLPGTTDPHVGGLMIYRASLADTQRQAGVYVGRILKGERPGDLPVMQPTKFELTINLNTAKALGLEVPASMQQLADEVIE
jgi:putative tryptophan/tyrosine transport system substrate-binding protein